MRECQPGSTHDQSRHLELEVLRRPEYELAAQTMAEKKGTDLL